MTVDNGTVSYNTNLTEQGYSIGTLAELHCDPGYRPYPSLQEPRRCDHPFSWNGQSQSCHNGNENQYYFA